jgi:hypothetical protein
MKKIYLAVPVFLLLVAAGWAAADSPRVGRPMIRSLEKSLDERLGRLWPDNPVAVVGATRGVYLDGIGAVFTAELNTASEGISLMHTSLTPKEKETIHRQKIDRVPQLKKVLEQALVETAGSLDPVPLDEQVVIQVILDRFTWEEAGGYPAELIVQSSKRKLLDLKRAGANPPSTALEAAIRVTEH